MLPLSFKWKVRSAIAGITRWQFSFRLDPGTIRTPQIVNFLGHLQRQLDRKRLIIEEGRAAHRSRRVRAYIERTTGCIRLAQLPASAPERNPVEFIWGDCTQHELPNVCPKDVAQLNQVARSRLRSMPRRPKLVAAFWPQAAWPL